MRVALYGALVTLFALVVGVTSAVVRPQWAFDGYVYGIRAQVNSGTSFAEARTNARIVYANKPGSDTTEAQRSMAADEPTWWRLFSVRVVYPAIASVFWSRLGFLSLFAVSVGAYVAAAFLLYVMLLRVARPEVAAIGSALTILHPEAQVLAVSPLTDMLAFTFLVATLLAAMRYVERQSLSTFALLCCAATLLAFTRPVPYIVACAAIPLIATRAWKPGAALFTLGLALCAAVAAVMHASSASVPPVAHLPSALMMTSVKALVLLLEPLAGPIAILALVYARRRTDGLIALGALGSLAVTIAVNPYPGDIARVGSFPALASLAFGFAIAVEALVCYSTSNAAAWNRPRRYEDGNHRIGRSATDVAAQAGADASR